MEFWSSAEYESFMPALVRELSASGISARSHFHISQRSYLMARGKVARFFLRSRMYASYPIHLATHCLATSGVACRVVCTNTFYAPLVASMMMRPSRTPLVHLVYDLFPDVLVRAGALKSESLLTGILHSLVRKTLSRSAANVFLGQRLLAYASQQFGEIPHATVIPVGADGEPYRASPPAPQPEGTPLRVLYCGNMGHMHDIETIAQVLREGIEMPGRSFTFLFHGNGAGFQQLRQWSTEQPLHASIQAQFGGFLPSEQWIPVMKSASLALITMRAGAETLLMPSKLYSALVAGQAILAICPSNSDLADTIRRYDCGWSVTPGDAAGLRALLKRISREPQLLLTKRLNAYRCGHDVFDMSHVAKRWIDLFESLGCATVAPTRDPKPDETHPTRMLLQPVKKL